MQSPDKDEIALDQLRWDDLRVFLALQRTGSLKRGAALLGVNVSTMSRRLDALEATLGLHLFDRTPEGTHPTAAAEQLLPFAEAMEHAAHGFVRGVEALEREVEGEVRLSAPPGLVDHFLAPALAELCDRYPRLRLTIAASIGYADLTRREADLALRTVRPRAGDLVVKCVARQGWCVIAAPKLAKRHQPLSDPNALRWLTWGEELANMPDRRWIKAEVAPEQVPLETNSMTAQLEAVRAGLGVMLAPTVYRELPGVTELRCAAKLRRSVAALPVGSLWLVGHRALREVPRIAAVWTWLEQQFARFERAE